MEKKKKQAMAELPRLELDTDGIATKAGTAGCYCFESGIPRTAICANGENVLIVTGSRGYLAVSHESLPLLIEELAGLRDDLGRIRRAMA